jgi:hypothetical protein
MYNSLVLRPEVDDKHIISIENTNARLFFLNQSDNNALKKVEDLLLDAYESRMSKQTTA